MSLSFDAKGRPVREDRSRIRPLRKPYEAGERIGLSTLVAPLPEPGRWVVRCERCGKTRAAYASAIRDHVEHGFDGGCAPCAYVVREAPRRCRLCGTSSPRRFTGSASECGRCARKRLRNGLCGWCGLPLSSWRRKKRCRPCDRDGRSRLPAHAPSSSRATQEALP